MLYISWPKLPVLRASPLRLLVCYKHWKVVTNFVKIMPWVFIQSISFLWSCACLLHCSTSYFLWWIFTIYTIMVLEEGYLLFLLSGLVTVHSHLTLTYFKYCFPGSGLVIHMVHTAAAFSFLVLLVIVQGGSGEKNLFIVSFPLTWTAASPDTVSANLFSEIWVPCTN